MIGTAYFCPACGHNPADQQFSQSINGIERSLDAVDAVRVSITDRDIAESTGRLIIENGLQNAVTAFQRCAEAIYSSLSLAAKARRNAFQNLTEGGQLWQTATGKTYADHLTSDELAALLRIFQQRHLLAHTQGIVDEDYILKSGDTRYKPGQRIVIRAEAVLEASALVEKLITGLQADMATSPTSK